MHVLAFDTSTSDVSIALSEISEREARLVASMHLPLAPPSAGDPAPAYTLSCALAELLVEAGSRMSDVELWALGETPGSGPWTEAARAFVQSLAKRTGRALCEISSLEVMAGEALRANLGLGAVVVAILRSHESGRFYAGAYQAGATPDDPPALIIPDGERSLEQLRGAIVEAKHARPKLIGPSLSMTPIWYGCGSGYLRVSSALRDLLSPIDPSSALPVFDPSLFLLARAAVRRGATND
jgi:tRNA A37 threonylcarbamoyladenosine modification protein TsaB